MATLEALNESVTKLQQDLQHERQRRKELEDAYKKEAARPPPAVHVATNKLPLPRFTGEGEDRAADCRRFIRSLDAYISQQPYTEAQKVELFRAALQSATHSSAARWWDNILDVARENTTTYDRCVRLLRARYEQKQTNTQLVYLIGSLVQKEKEEVLDFADRVNSVARDFVRTLPTPLLPGARDHDDIMMKEAIQDAWAKFHFVVGLRPSIKNKTLIQDFATFADVRSIADRVEVAEEERTPKTSAGTFNALPPSKLPTVVVNELTQQYTATEWAEAMTYIAAKRHNSASRGGRRGPRGQRGGRNTGPSRPTHPNAKPAWITPQNLPAEYCLRCGFRGHSAAQCTVKPERYRWPAAIKELNLTPGSVRALTTEPEGDTQGGAHTATVLEAFPF